MSKQQQQTPWLTDVVSTSDALAHTATNATYTPPTGVSGLLDLEVVARLTGSNDAVAVFHYIQAYKNVSGTVSLVGTTVPLYSDTTEESVSVAIVLSGSTIQPRVTGIASTTFSWTVSAKYDVH
jgi:hypothetical protein